MIKATKEKNLKVEDSLLKKDIVKMNLDVLLGKPPKLTKKISSSFSLDIKKEVFDSSLEDAISKVLKYPSVSSKSF